MATRDKAIRVSLVFDRLADAIDGIDEKIDEYSKNIYGYNETAFMDVLYEEYAAYLTELREELKTTREMLR